MHDTKLCLPYRAEMCYSFIADANYVVLSTEKGFIFMNKMKRKGLSSRENSLRFLIISTLILSVICVTRGVAVNSALTSALPAVSSVSDVSASEPTVPEKKIVYDTFLTERAECSGSLTITDDNARVRSDAGAEFELVADVKKGEKYNVIAQKDSSTGRRWFEISLPDKTGYIAGSSVKYDGVLLNAKAYLTFDDGPSDNTTRILDILDRYGVKATFFVIYHSGYDDVYRDIVKRGHTLALHSYSHDYDLIYSSDSAFFGDLEKLAGFLQDTTGVKPSIMRFPGGASNTVSKSRSAGIMTRLTAEVEKRGYRYFDWNVDSGDAMKNKVPKNEIVDRVKRECSTHSQAVILMHDAAVKTTTVDALPEVIEYLQSKGYELLPITEGTRDMHHKVLN